MNDRLKKYLDGIFSPYEGERAVTELKEELFADLQERMRDFKDKGYDDETAYHMTIESIGDIKEIIESISVKAKELKQIVRHDLSKTNLQDSDLRGVIVHDGKFDYSDLKGSDFSGSDLRDSSFKCSDLNNVMFDGANLGGAQLSASNLKKTSFDGASMDKLTYAVLKGSKANLKNVTVL